MVEPKLPHGLSLRTAEKEAEGANLTGPQRQQYIQQKMEEDQLARKQERQKQERNTALTREGSNANQAGAVGALKEQLLRMRGDPHAAELMQEYLARRKDEVGRKEPAQKYIGDGFTGVQPNTSPPGPPPQEQIHRTSSGGGI